VPKAAVDLRAAFHAIAAKFRQQLRAPTESQIILNGSYDIGSHGPGMQGRRLRGGMRADSA